MTAREEMAQVSVDQIWRVRQFGEGLDNARRLQTWKARYESATGRVPK
jgi:hypothetical protein